MQWKRWRDKRPRISVIRSIFEVNPALISILLRVLIFSIWEFLPFLILLFSIFLIRFLSRDILSNQLILDIAPNYDFLCFLFEWTFEKSVLFTCTGLMAKSTEIIFAHWYNCERLHQNRSCVTESFIIVPTSSDQKYSEAWTSVVNGGGWFSFLCEDPFKPAGYKCVESVVNEDSFLIIQHPSDNHIWFKTLEFASWWTWIKLLKFTI